MIRLRNCLMIALLASGVAACGGSAGGKGALAPEERSGKIGRDGKHVSKAAAEGFKRALESFVAHDKKQDWNEATCKSVAQAFLDASEKQRDDAERELTEAIYNAGLAQQRCGNHEEALKHFERALQVTQDFHRARAQLALYKFKRTNDIDDAIRELDQIIRDAKFQNVEALVSLAALQMERGSDQSGQGCENDLDCAKLNLQRALAIDDGYMAAFNQLAIYYLEQAKAKAGRQKHKRGRRGLVVSGAKTTDVNEQQLDLAALVASQAQRKNPNYAPIHNTTGLILVELKNYNGAVKSFGRARRLDQKFFEAHMNYAAVNLSFRGFKEAELAYRDALKLRPKEFEAHLGLALALRGQINDANFDKVVAEAQKHLDQAKEIDPSRPETYYNEAILTHEFRAKRGNAIPVLEKAAGQYKEFVAKAGSDSQFAEAVKRSENRAQDIEDTIRFIREGEQAKRQAEADERRRKEEEARKKKEEEAAAKAAEAEKKAAEAAGKPAEAGKDAAGNKPAESGKPKGAKPKQ